MPTPGAKMIGDGAAQGLNAGLILPVTKETELLAAGHMLLSYKYTRATATAGAGTDV